MHGVARWKVTRARSNSVVLGAALFAIAFLATSARSVSAQDAEEPSSSIELVDPHVFRVCADPRDLPFSNQAGEGFENKIAELFAKKLGKSLAYAWYPGATGFVRNTLNAHKCDVIMGFPQGNDFAQVTNPYYRTAYALVSKPGGALEKVDSLDDPLLKGKRIGVVAGTPPSSYMAKKGLFASAKSYPLVIDTRTDSSSQEMIKDIEAGEIDAGVLWGPIAGYYAKKAKLSVVPLVKEKGGPRLAYRIGMGVRPSDQEFKRLLNRMIAENQRAIDAILLDYGVPLLDENDRPIASASLKQD
jgi:quinoprotein dehydrogenase-associated probable ABC transporter substrate-binding protein